MKISKIKKNCRIKIDYIYTRVNKDLTKSNENIRNKAIQNFPFSNIGFSRKIEQICRTKIFFNFLINFLKYRAAIVFISLIFFEIQKDNIFLRECLFVFYLFIYFFFFFCLFLFKFSA